MEAPPPPENLHFDNLRPIKVLGNGAMGTVFLVHNLISDPSARSPFALKVSRLHSDHRARWEITVLRRLHLNPHPFLPFLIGSSETNEFIAWAIPFCPGRDLNILRHRQPDNVFSVSVIRFYLAEIVCALEHLHSMGIVFRDLKPENVLVQETGHVTLTDFDLSRTLTISTKKHERHTCAGSKKYEQRTCIGSKKYEPCTCAGSKKYDQRTCIGSKKCEPCTCIGSKKINSARVLSVTRATDTNSAVYGERSNSFVGTEEYLSPEMVRGDGHEFSVDWWAVGILAYEMLYGTTPFRGKNRKDTFARILTMEPKFTRKTTTLTSLISKGMSCQVGPRHGNCRYTGRPKLLEKEPTRRLGYEKGAREIKEHEFFRGVRWNMLTEVVRPPFIPSRDYDNVGLTVETIGVEMLAIVLMVLLHDCVMGKECTNIPTQLSSHTFRYNLLNSNNKTWISEVYSHHHLTPTDDSAWAGLLPRRSLKQEDEFSWRMMYKNIKNPDGGFLNELPLSDVRLDPDSVHGQAQQTNLEYLLMLDVDRLVYSFRITSGLPTIGMAYGGHYLSASAQMWASTGNSTLENQMTAVVSALAACQDRIGTGYLSAFPPEFFDRFEAIKRVWAPYYTIHKIMAGLVDQYIVAGNSQALKMVTRMADYFCRRVQNVITRYTIERHWLSLNEETGGMNDVLYRLYTITGDIKHLWLAHLFDKPCFLGLLALKADDISGYHANSHIPIVIGAQRRYEVTGDPLYKEIGTFFMDIVNASHMYSTGGTSFREFWSEPKRLASTLHTENEESCTTYNMLKVSRNLFRWTKEMAYADYYERALTNSVLSIQRGKEPGIMIYMLPLAPGSSKATGFHKWGSKFNDFWCCYGTGIESFSKMGDSIYFEEAGNSHALYIIQYISSSVDWKSGQVFLAQKVKPAVSWDPHLRVTMIISSKKQGASSTLKFRIPFWTTSDAKASLNGQAFSPTPGTFLSLSKQWSSNDLINLDLPITLRMEAIQDDRPEYASIHAILYGPYLLVGLTDGDIDLRPDHSLTSLTDWIIPVPAEFNSQLISVSQESISSTLVLSHTANSITMQKLPEPGSNSSVFATFRLVFTDQNNMNSQAVMLEPFSLPGSFLVHQGREQRLAIGSYSITWNNSVFYIVTGGDGTVRLEAQSEEGCFVSNAGGVVKLECDYGRSDDEFLKATSFVMRDGISRYDPISFVAKGLRRDFLLQPLFSLRDEHYTVYFNINQ
ncbi:hypothetical protein SSX86_002609 [Deinandra increscens subsp. villosa]|uniref:non-specific serine/threonine protein kinase n=1 Tax=Deinandra increscens subsp. villosa TaxID=3103831 RepID=A0AAP0HBF9_9ASTR